MKNQNNFNLFSGPYKPMELIEIKLNDQWFLAQYLGPGKDVHHSLILLDGKKYNHFNSHIRRIKS